MRRREPGGLHCPFGCSVCWKTGSLPDTDCTTGILVSSRVPMGNAPQWSRQDADCTAGNAVSRRDHICAKHLGGLKMWPEADHGPAHAVAMVSYKEFVYAGQLEIWAHGLLPVLFPAHDCARMSKGAMHLWFTCNLLDTGCRAGLGWIQSTAAAPTVMLGAAWWGIHSCRCWRQI